MASVSLIIVNHNAGDLLLSSINSCANQVDQIVIIDNASTDNSLCGIEPTSTIMVIRNAENIGFASACNQGVTLADGQYLLFLNPDCLALPGAIKSLLLAIDGNSEVGMVGGLLLNPDGTEQAGCRRNVPTPWRAFVKAFNLSRLSNRYPRLFEDFILPPDSGLEDAQDVEAISGACMLVNRISLDDVGLLDSCYFMHCEDLDWCMRFRMNQWKIKYVPSAKFIHYKGACSNGRPIFVEWHKHKGMLRFYRKFFRHQYPGLLMWLVGVGVWMRFAYMAGYFFVRSLRHNSV